MSQNKNPSFFCKGNVLMNFQNKLLAVTRAIICQSVKWPKFGTVVLSMNKQVYQ